MISAKFARQLINKESVVLDTTITRKIINVLSESIERYANAGKDSIELICKNPDNKYRNYEITTKLNVIVYLDYFDAMEFLYPKIMILVSYLESQGYAVDNLTDETLFNFQFKISW